MVDPSLFEANPEVFLNIHPTYGDIQTYSD